MKGFEGCAAGPRATHPSRTTAASTRLLTSQCPKQTLHCALSVGSAGCRDSMADPSPDAWHLMQRGGRPSPWPSAAVMLQRRNPGCGCSLVSDCYAQTKKATRHKPRGHVDTAALRIASVTRGYGLQLLWQQRSRSMHDFAPP